MIYVDSHRAKFTSTSLELIFPLFLISGYILVTISILRAKLLFNIVSVDASCVFDFFVFGSQGKSIDLAEPPAAYVYCVATKLRPPPLSPSKLVFTNNSSDDEA